MNLLKEIAVKLEVLDYVSEMTDLAYECVTEIDNCLVPDVLDVLCILAVKVNNHEMKGDKSVEIQISNRCFQSLMTETSDSKSSQNQFVVVMNPLVPKRAKNEPVYTSLFHPTLLTESGTLVCSPLRLFIYRVLDDFFMLMLNEHLSHPTLLTVRTAVCDAYSLDA